MLNESDLRQFHGTDQWHMHWSKRLLYTDGVKYVADHGEAYWLIDAIASYQSSPLITKNEMLRDMQFWKLTVSDGKGVLTCVEDTGMKPVIKQEIEFTDFPLSEIEIWVERGDYMTAMLPGER